MKNWKQKIKQKFFSLCYYFKWNEAEKIFDKIQVVLTVFMQLVFIVSFLLAFHERQWEVVFISLVAMFTIWIPIVLGKRRQINIPISIFFLFTLFIYGSLFLGEVLRFYDKFWWWDKILHFGSGLALGFLGFLIIYSFFLNNNLKPRPFLSALFSFSFSLALGALWEIFEFGMDNIFKFNMQKSSLVDTMWDLIADSLGALIVAISGYLYIKYRKRGVGIFQYYLIEYLRRNI